MQQQLVSHALQDINPDTFFDNDQDDLASMQQLAGAGAGVAAAKAGLRPAPPKGPKPFSDVPLPPPDRPLKWKTKLADRATAAVDLEARYQLPPHLLFELLADPRQHDKIFDAILAADAELLEEDGPKRKWRLDYSARWNFWKVSGVCENRLWMWTDSEAGTVTFKLREPGFLKRYEGTWTITAGCGSPLAAFSSSAAAPGSPAAAASPASSTYDLRSSSSSSSSGASSSRGSSPNSSPRSSWADGVPTADIFGANLSRNGSGNSNSSGNSSISMRTLPLASLASATAGSGSPGLPQGLGQGVTTAAAALGSTISSTMWRLLGYTTTSGSGSNDGATTSSSAAVDPSDSGGQQQWPPLFKRASFNSVSSTTSGSSSSSSSLGSVDLEVRPQLRPMPTSAVITASSLTSPKLTPPYPLNALLKVQSRGQVEEMLEGLVRAAAAKLQAVPLQGL